MLLLGDAMVRGYIWVGLSCVERHLCCHRHRVTLPDDNTHTYIRALKDNINGEIQMVLCLLPTNRKDRYDAIKTFCCIENPG